MWTYLSYAISGSIVGFSIWDAVRTAPEASTHPHWLRRSGPKLATLLLGLALLGVQAKSNAVAGVEADKKLHQALTDQRDQLTAAFKAGTDQVIKSATGEAEQTRKDAGTETDAIRRQATEQLSQVQGFMLGTTNWHLQTGTETDTSTVASTTETPTTATACVWVCCPGASDPCSTTDPCP